MSTPPLYKAILDPETGKWFFHHANGRCQGFRFEKTAQRLADSFKKDDQQDLRRTVRNSAGA